MCPLSLNGKKHVTISCLQLLVKGLQWSIQQTLHFEMSPGKAFLASAGKRITKRLGSLNDEWIPGALKDLNDEKCLDVLCRANNTQKGGLSQMVGGKWAVFSHTVKAVKSFSAQFSNIRPDRTYLLCSWEYLRRSIRRKNFFFFLNYKNKVIILRQ